jgi:hypothetical protein
LVHGVVAGTGAAVKRLTQTKSGRSGLAEVMVTRGSETAKQRSETAPLPLPTGPPRPPIVSAQPTTASTPRQSDTPRLSMI